MAIGALVSWAVSAGAQIATADADGFVGRWTLALDFNGREVEMSLEFRDNSGWLAASLSSPQSAGPSAIENLVLNGPTLTLGWWQSIQGQDTAMRMALDLVEGVLAGSFGDRNGLFSAELVGWKVGADRPAVAKPQGVARVAQTVRQESRLRGATTELIVGDRRIRIAYSDLERADGDYSRLQELGNDEVFAFTNGRATKLLTEASLKFGDTVVEKGNVHSSYPGVYSLWLRKVDGGWRLIFNVDADIWGTQRQAELDVAEVPLSIEQPLALENRFKIELAEAAGGGVLRMVWGQYQWTVRFEVID